MASLGEVLVLSGEPPRYSLVRGAKSCAPWMTVFLDLEQQCAAAQRAEEGGGEGTENAVIMKGRVRQSEKTERGHSNLRTAGYCCDVHVPQPLLLR